MSLDAIEREALQKLSRRGKVPRLNILSDLIRKGYVEKTLDGYEVVRSVEDEEMQEEASLS